MNEKINRLIDGFLSKKLWGTRGLNADIARRTGFTRSYVGQVFKGTKEPSDKFLIAVCGIYGIRQEWIERGEMPVLKQPKDFELDKDYFLAVLGRRVPDDPNKVVSEQRTIDIAELGLPKEGNEAVRAILSKQASEWASKEAEKIITKNEGIKSYMIEQITDILPKLHLEEVGKIHRYVLKIFESHMSERLEP